jgi:predicted transcriptional regulator
MDVRKKPVRIDAALLERLSKLGKALKLPQSHLVGEAIKEYLARRARKAESDLEASLEDLRAYRKSDPDFEQSFERFIEAELRLKDDPAEGTVFMEGGAGSEPPSPARETLHKILNG